jgi:hypothetical protein
MGKNKDRDQDPGSGINIPDHISQRLVTIFGGLKYLNFLLRIRIRDLVTFRPGMEKFGSGIRGRTVHWEGEHGKI